MFVLKSTTARGYLYVERVRGVDDVMELTRRQVCVKNGEGKLGGGQESHFASVQSVFAMSAVRRHIRQFGRFLI